MGDVSSRKFYRGRPRVFTAPTSTTEAQQASPRAHKKNMQRHAAKRAKRELDESSPTEETAAAASASVRWVLVTGQPGCGKTTLVRSIADTCAARGLSLTGFYTQEVRGGEGGSRTGFDVVSVGADEARGVLARKAGGGSHQPRVGAYSVDVASFEAVALPSLDPARVASADLVILDEIGRMELHSERFKDAVRRLLADERVRLVGALTAPIYGHRVPFCDEIAAQTHAVSVHRLTQKTRDEARVRVEEAVNRLL